MRAVIQRVSAAEVKVEGKIVGRIGAGSLVLLGVTHADGEPEARWLADKIANLRMFPDETHPINRSLLDVGGGCLVVSQFTLYGDCRRGRRPSFVDAARPEQAEPLYERFCALLAEAGVRPVERGIFGAHMDVSLTNDGPVTLVVEAPTGPQAVSKAAGPREES
jgi:D-aminoacyl-tRNA deacylase